MKNFRLSVNVIASAAMLSQGFYYAVTQPGPMDLVNGSVLGIVLFAIWFNRERTT